MSMIYVSWVGAYLFCPRRLWIMVRHNIREADNFDMRRGRFLHDLKHHINQSGSIIDYDDCPELISDIEAQVVPLAEAYNFDPAFLSKYISDEVWKASGMAQKGVRVLTEQPIMSEEIGIKGRCDRVEFFTSDSFMYVWDLKTCQDDIKTPTEYYLVQLALYALMLEEQYKCPVRKGFLEVVNGKSKSIIGVPLTQELRGRARALVEEVKESLNSDTMPEAKMSWKCRSCSDKIAKMCPVWAEIKEANQNGA